MRLRIREETAQTYYISLPSTVPSAETKLDIWSPSCRHLRDLMLDEKRCMSLIKEAEGIFCDFSRQRVTDETMALLMDLAKASDLRGKIDAMFGGEHINTSEDRAVLHVATRARRDQKIFDKETGKNVVPEVWDVLDKIKGVSQLAFITTVVHVLSMDFCPWIKKHLDVF